MFQVCGVSVSESRKSCSIGCRRRLLFASGNTLYILGAFLFINMYFFICFLIHCGSEMWLIPFIALLNQVLRDTTPHVGAGQNLHKVHTIAEELIALSDWPEVKVITCSGAL